MQKSHWFVAFTKKELFMQELQTVGELQLSQYSRKVSQRAHWDVFGSIVKVSFTQAVQTVLELQLAQFDI